MADGKVIIDTSLDNKGFTKGVRNLKNDMSGLEAVAKKVGRTLAVVFSAKAIFDFGKACVKLGSDIAEVQNVVDVAFGDMAYKIEEFAKSSIQNFGMSKLTAKETASNFMSMGRSMGLSAKAASDMAVAVTGLTGDVASFFNISQDLAKIRLRGIWTGETEALKELGVVMTETNLKEYALAKGVGKSYDEMTQAERVTLRYLYVTNALALANGDFVRTQDNWANQTRILSEQWKEFMSILGQMIITVLTPLVKTLNSIATSMIDAANAANSFMVTLFGGTKTQMQQTQDQADQVGGAIEGSVEDQGDLTEAVKDTNKEAKKSLLAFDELNKITETTASSAGPEIGNASGVGGSLGTTVGEELEKGLSEQMKGLVESLKQTFGELKQWFISFWEPFSISWDISGGVVIASAKFALLELINLVKELGASFMAVWSNGTGVAILTTIHSIISNVLAIVGTLAQKFREAWEANGNGAAFWQSILNIIQLVLNFIDRVAAATLEWAQGINFEPIMTAFRGLLDAIAPVVEIILDNLAWAYENILLPLATWVIEAAGPAAVDALSAAFRVLSEYMDACSETWRWLWETFLKPLADWIGDVILSALHWLADALNNLADWMRDNQDKVQDFTIVVGSMATAFLAVVSALKIFNAAKALISGVSAAFMAMTSPVGVVVVAIGALIAVVALLVRHWDEIKEGARIAWEAICNTWNAAGEWLKKNVLDPIVDGIKGAINFVLDLVEGFVNFFISGINAIIDGLNSLSFDVPDWVPLIGGNTFGFNISNVPELSIPRLATGAVIPPNNEFLAVLGDQKHGTNIEVPEGLLRQIFREESGKSGGVQRIELVLKPKPGFARYLSYELDEAAQNRGIKLVKGAVMG